MADLQSEKLTIIKIANGAPGTPGTSGSNYATVYLYRRFASTPSSSDKPTGNVTYTFSSGAVSGSLNNWQRTVPTGTNPCYMILAQTTAPAGTATDTIAKSEWSTPVEVFKNGSDGSPGADAYNQATIYLYKRSATPLTNNDEPTNLIYTFASGLLEGNLNGWTRYVPPSGNNHYPCYVISTSPVSQNSSITISDWADPTKLVEDGTSITVVSTQYQEGTSYDTEPTGQWSNTPVQVTPGNYLWTKITYSDGSFSYAVSRQGEDGEDAGQYQIQSSQQRFLRYLSKNADEVQLLYEISPGTLKFSIKNLKTNTLEVFTENEMDIKLINSFLSEGQTYKSEYSIKTVLGNPNNAYWEYDDDNNITACFLKIDALYNYSQQEVDDASDDVKGLHDALKAFFNQLQGNICISIGNNIYKAEKYFAIQNGLTDEMIEFQINARNIQAAIDNKKLVFDDNGLTIDNGGFIIRQSNDQGGYNRIFYIDPEQKQIWMQGSGTFTGTITANEGQIGGFSIGEYSITSNGLELYSEHSEDGQIIESKIFAQNLEIGTGANIQNYLQIGNLKLLNPELEPNDNYVMKLEDNGETKFSLTNDGNGYFNGIINATDGCFSGEIIASVINASTINTANFVSEETRTMGGSFIYKPAFEVVKIEEGGSGSTSKTKKIKITLTSNAKAYAISNESGKDRIISLSGNGIRYGKLVDDNNWTEDTIYGEFTTNDHDIILDQSEIYNTITFYGYGNDTDLLIGINSDNDRVGNIMPPRALVMESFSNLNIPETSGSGTITYNTKLLLGDLSSIKSIVGDNAGYGLYSDNVYLKGSLTTTGGDSNYAGVNTRGPINFDYGLWDTGTSDTSKYSNHKIIFWGGANSITNNEIQKSHFIITDKGSIFATSGEFKGSVISDSIISKSVIQAAIIEGTGTSPSLKIYDTGSNGGIGFYKKVNNIDGINNNEDNDELTLSIDTTGLTYLTNKKFIEFNTNEVIATLGRANFEKLQINDQGINSNDENIKIKLNNNDRITINANGVTNTGNYITNEGTTIFTSEGKTLKYIVKDGYYVLYVEEVNTQS